MRDDTLTTTDPVTVVSPVVGPAVSREAVDGADANEARLTV